MACGPAEFSGLGEGHARCLEVVGASVGLCQAKGREGAQLQVLLGQERQRSLGKRDCAVRLSLKVSAPGWGGCDASHDNLADGLVRARPQILIAAFPAEADGASFPRVTSPASPRAS